MHSATNNQQLSFVEETSGWSPTALCIGWPSDSAPNRRTAAWVNRKISSDLERFVSSMKLHANRPAVERSYRDLSVNNAQMSRSNVACDRSLGLKCASITGPYLPSVSTIA